MKTKILYLLIISFLINSILCFFVYPVIIHSLKARFNENSGKKIKTVSRIIEVETVKLPKLMYVDENEIIFEGKLYDILKIEGNENTTKLFCYHDKEEERVNKNFKENLNHRKKGNIPFFMFAFFSTLIETNGYKGTVWQNNPVSPFIIVHYKSIIKEVTSPPPRLV